MRLGSVGGPFIELRPVRYQFPGNAGDGRGRDWDANWLVVRGDIRTADGRSWTFEDPWLTTWEARALGLWLRGVVSGETLPTPFDGSKDERLLVFTEPNVALSLEERTDNSALIRVHLSLEAGPPWLRGKAGPDIFEYFVVIGVPLNRVTAAVDDWDQELASFPER